MKIKKYLACFLCVCMVLSLVPTTAMAATTESYGADAAVTTVLNEYGNTCVSGFSVPEGLFYYSIYDSEGTDYKFRGGAFNTNSATNPVKAYSPSKCLVVPMICVWDYRDLSGTEYPDNISLSNGIVNGTANDTSDTWLITNMQTDFLPILEDRAAFSELVLPMSLWRIGKYAVQKCESLTRVTFYDLNNSRLEIIDEMAFANCPLLSYVEFPNTLTTIADDAFLNCSSLKSITVPALVKTIGQHALGYTTTDGNIYTKVDDFVIKGYKGSTAQEYATRCGFTFISLDGSEDENWQGTGAVDIDNFTQMPKATYTSGQFTDVNEDEWYGANKYKAIQTAYELRIIVGKGDNLFDPNGDVLLSEALKMAAVVHNIYSGGNGVFTPKSWEQWYTPYVDYCIAEEIIVSGDFAKDYARPATRAEMAYIFANALPDSELQTTNDVTIIPDVSYATPYYDEIISMYRCGALRGNDDYGTFTPYDNITRAAAAAIIARIALPEQRLIFTLKEPEKEISGSYTSGMWIEDIDTIEKVFKERVWGLYSGMYVYMDEELANMLNKGNYYFDWVAFAVNINSEYNSNLDQKMEYTFTNYNVSFELDALIADSTVSPRASANALKYLAKIDEIIASMKLSGKSEREKLLAIHDWMVANISYDTDYADASYQFYGPLDNGKAVCQGYAELFYYFARRVGIECYTVLGLASSGPGMTDWEDHVWNEVYLTGDKTPYFIDVTFDDPIPDTTTGRHTYFMVSQEKLSEDHK